MSEEGERTQRDLTKATKISSVNTRLLWTGIRTTNRELEKNTKEISENTNTLTKFSEVQTLLASAVTSEIVTLRLGFAGFTDLFKDVMYHVAKTISEVFFGLVNSMQILDRTLKDNTNMLLKALGSEEHWRSKEEILSDHLVDSLNTFKIDTDAWVNFLHDTEWGKDFWEVIQEQAKDAFDAIRNWGVMAVGKTFEEQTGFIADKHPFEMGKLKIKFFEEIDDFTDWMSSTHLTISKNIADSIYKIYEQMGLGKDGEEGLGDSKVQKGADKAGNFVKMFGLRMVMKGVEAMKALIKQIIDVAKSPFTEMFGDTLGGLVKILNSVLRPLKPFFFLLDLLATVIEAALTPLTIELWEEFDVVIKKLVGSIPELIEDVSEWITEDGELEDTINLIVEGVRALVDAFVTGDLLKKLYDMSVNLLILAASLVTTDEDGITLIERFIELSLAITKLAVALTPLLDVIEWIVQALTGLTNLATSFWTEDWFGGGKPPGVSEGIPAPLPHLPIMQEGGRLSYTGAFIGHAGETVHKKGIDDEMLDMMSEMVYLQKRILKMKEERYR